MINKIVKFLKEHNLQDKTVIVGFSGGYDSMCLLDILSKIKDLPDFFDFDVIAAHFNHNWRGEESLREQEICRLFASSRGFEFYTRTAPASLRKTEKKKLLRKQYSMSAIPVSPPSRLLWMPLRES